LRKQIALLAAALLGLNAAAQTPDRASWTNLGQLKSGESVEVSTVKGQTLKGRFVKVSDDAISLERKQQEVAVPRAEVARVARRSGKQRKATLIGLAIGAGAGAGVGAGAAQTLDRKSGGDFSNLKPAVIGAVCAIGALVGTVVGFSLGGRGTEVYRAR
jgi:hypothetical protein